ncbi:MAG: hypothetical protein ACYCSH_10325 [Acidithiobacillus sp.]
MAATCSGAPARVVAAMGRSYTDAHTDGWGFDPWSFFPVNAGAASGG